MAARDSLKWMMNKNFIPFVRSIWPQKLPLMLWVKNGRVMCSESVGTTNKVFPMKQVSGPMVESTRYWVRGIPVTDQGGLEKESTNLYRVALWMPI